MSTTHKPVVRDSSSDSDGAPASKPQVAPASPAPSTLAPAATRDTSARRWALFSGPRSDARRERYRHEVLDVADGARAVKHLDGEKGALPASAPTAEAESTGLGRTMGWKGCAWNSCAYSIALGILSLPSVCATLGVAPFVILACVFALLTYYTGMSYFRLQQRYPGIHSLEDAGDLLFGRVGAFVLGWTQVIFSIFLQGNHVLLGAKAFNALGWRAPQTCAIALYVVFAIISFLFSLPRSYKLFSWLAVFSVISILVSVLIVLVASGVTGPADGTVVQPIRAAAQPAFLDAALAITNLFVSFGSSPSYLPLMAEMRDPKGGFPRALKTLVIFQLVLYSVVGCVVYRNLGPDVASPSIAALQPIYQKAAYGTGLGTILLAGCESAQVSGKVLYVKLFRMRPSLFKSKAWGWGLWTGINVVTWILAAILAMVLPFFSSFLGVEASAFWSAFLAAAAAFSVYCALEERSLGEITKARCTVMLALAGAVLCVTTFIAITGMWASAVSIRDSYAQGIVGRPFSCAITDA